MRKIDGFVMRRLGNETIIVAESVELIKFDKIVSLNSSAAYIWGTLPDSGFSAETIAGLLERRYDVDRTTAYEDAEELVKMWLEAGIIKE